MALSSVIKDKLQKMGSKGLHITITGNSVSFPFEMLGNLSKEEIEEIKVHIQSTEGL